RLIHAAPFGLPPARDTAAAPGPRTADVPLIENLDETRISTGERPFARLVWDDGTRQAVYGRTLFGRNPAPETGAMVSAVRDETLSLSKTHFELVPADDRSVWVVDRHSTNGVVLRHGVGGAEAQPLVPGERTRVRSGDVLEFGDRQVTIEVAS
ncbi:FHA domain-containing protein, partial [Microbacterium hominis]|uniref:FHA domain-containing protein n=1 Tax=Microbacterium hominis TaxID=162426 RepID=UPI000AC06CD1